MVAEGISQHLRIADENAPRLDWGVEPFVRVDGNGIGSTQSR